VAGEKTMNERAFFYSIHSELPAHPEQPASLGVKFLTTLDALSDIEPIFANWQVMKYGPGDSFPLPTVRPRIAVIIENNVHRDDLREPLPDEGYTLGAYTETTDARRTMFLRINAGGKKQRGDTSLQLGSFRSPSDPAVVTYPLYKAALLAINASWPPPWACAYAFEGYYYEEALSPGAPPFPYSKFHIPWIAYLSTPLAKGLELPAEILTERTAGGGVLMIAAEERLDPSNGEHLRRARILAETMVKHTGGKFGPKPKPLIRVDPDTGRYYNPRTGKTAQYDPRTGELLDE
jgi:hypothetical protein